MRAAKRGHAGWGLDRARCIIARSPFVGWCGNRKGKEQKEWLPLFVTKPSLVRADRRDRKQPPASAATEQHASIRRTVCAYQRRGRFKHATSAERSDTLGLDHNISEKITTLDAEASVHLLP